MRTYDELLEEYKDCELQRENLILENEDLKHRISKALNLNRNIDEYKKEVFQEILNDILRGID